ncbi:MAG TPA: phenylalanine--tRNA ligase beta subunit-related protein, partial [Rhodothermales bacterium]|nr:phenylalanine--tRNA ligase beta subunit-related protein [Rhodothermales bacterium]
LGIVRAEGIEVEQMPLGFEVQLAALLAARREPLTDAEDALRGAARNMLRNGSYKPTGRGKPASEYLVRAAHDSKRHFPRINAPVDICNYISLKTLLPVSLWDLDLAETMRFCFRLGREDETYLFNAGGQTIKLHDLVVGCRVDETTSADGEPIINPVKDSLATKTTDATHNIAACIYTPLAAVTTQQLEQVCTEFAEWLAGCGDAVDTAWGVALPGEEVEV